MRLNPHDTQRKSESQSPEPTSTGSALIARLLAEFVRAQSDTLDDIIGRAVEELGQLARTNRCYIFQVQPNGTLCNTHEWVGPGVEPVIDDLKDVPFSLLDACMPAFRQDGLFHSPDIAALPEDNALKPVLLEQDIKAILLVPFWNETDVIGFIGFDNTDTAEPFEPTVISLLSSIADVIGTTLHRLTVQAANDQARKDLELSNQRLAQVFQSVPDMMFELDPDGHYTGLAIGPQDKMLVTMEERTGLHYRDVLPPEIGDVVGRGVEAAKNGQVSAAERYQLVHGGQMLWHEMTVAPVGTPNARDFRMIIVVRDVTVAERARRDVERTALVAQLMTNLVIMSDAEGRVIWANTAFERKSGYSLAEMQGRPLYKFTRTSGTDPKIEEGIAEAMAARRPFSGQLLNATRSGEDYWVDLNITYQDAGNDGNGIFVSVATDITSQKRSEEILARYVAEERRTSEKLRDAMKHTETILDSVEDAILSIDSHGAILSGNKAAEEIFGNPSLQLKGRNIALLLTRTHGREFATLFGDDAVESSAMIGQTHFFDAVRKDGTIFPIELKVSEVESSKDGDGFFIVVIRDITERKKVEQMQSEFLATVSHELRTPLTSVHGTLSLIRGGVVGKLADKELQLVEAALGNTKMLEDLINDVLDLEKLQHGKLDIELAPECLPTLIKDAVRLSDAYARKFDVSLRIDTDIPQASVNIDASRAQQILTNYLSNAIKYSEKGADVVVKATQDDAFVRVSVVDTGAGIPKDKQGILFEKFAQADTSDARSKRGTGLGLAIVQELATRMGGRVGFVSEEGKGSEFWVDFALSATDADDQSLPITGDHASTGVKTALDESAVHAELAKVSARH